MKKLISLIAALAMVSSLFVTTSFAAAPANLTLNVVASEADADQIAEYEDNVNAVPEGYTLYAVTFSQTGLGDWENTNSKTTAAQLKKPSGWLANSIAFEMDFASDIANVYGDTDYLFVESSYDFGVSISGTKLTLTYGPWTTSVNYPLNAKGESALEEGAPIAILYVPVSDSATCTFTEQTVIAMQEYADGVAQSIDGGSDLAEYSLANSNIILPSSVTLGASAPAPVEEPGIAADEEKVEAQANGTTGLTDLEDNAVTLSKNYGIAKFTQAINTGLKDYYVYAKDTAGNTNITVTDGTIAAADKAAAAPFKINFGIEGIETSGTVSFYALVHSTTHVIDTIRLIAVDK